MTITTATVRAAGRALHTLATGQEPEAKQARADLSLGAQWTLVALDSAIQHAYLRGERGPALPVSSATRAASLVDEVHAFLCEDWKRANEEHDPATGAIDVAGEVAYAACLVLQAELRKD